MDAPKDEEVDRDEGKDKDEEADEGEEVNEDEDQVLVATCAWSQTSMRLSLRLATARL